MRRRSLFHIDYGLLVPVFILIVLSLTILFSLNISLFKSQLFFLIVSFLAFLFFSQSDYNVIKFYSFPIYSASLVLLLSVLIIGIETRGSFRWVEFFGIRIQFSEILKPFFIISFSSYLENHTFSFRSASILIGFLLPIIILVLIQPDLGNATVLMLSSLLALLIFGFPLWWYGIGCVGVMLAMPILWRFLRDYQKERLFTFINPTKDPLGGSYNVIQSIIAVGSGMFFGRGIGEATQSGLRFLPERHTDFIFATLSEALGFVGVLLVLLCFGFLLYRIYILFQEARDTFSKIFTICAFSLLLTQFFINIGMNIGILPVTGITLPFVSYGGSSLLSNFVLLGFLTSISKVSRRREALEIR